MLKAPLISLALVKAVESLQSFDLIFVMTGSGPGTATETLDVYAYRVGINMGGKISYASAMAILLMIITTVALAFTIVLPILRSVPPTPCAATTPIWPPLV